LFPSAEIVPSEAKLGTITGPSVSSPLSLNVVRGAALRNQFRMEGLLPCSFGYQSRDLRTPQPDLPVSELLEPNKPPGGELSSEKSICVIPGHEHVLEFFVKSGDGPWESIYLQRLVNDSNSEARFVFRLEYALDGAVYLRLQQVLAVDGRAVRVSLFKPDQRRLLIR